MSCSLPLPLAIFCASAICARTAWRMTVNIPSIIGPTGQAYIKGEVLQGEALHSIDAELGVGLNNGETTRDYFSETRRLAERFISEVQRHQSQNVRKKRFVAPLSSMTSTTPGRSCSIEGTWLARTPISPDSAGMLTWTLEQRKQTRQYAADSPGDGSFVVDSNVHIGGLEDVLKGN